MNSNVLNTLDWSGTQHLKKKTKIHSYIDANNFIDKIYFYVGIGQLILYYCKSHNAVWISDVQLYIALLQMSLYLRNSEREMSGDILVQWVEVPLIGHSDIITNLYVIHLPRDLQTQICLLEVLLI